MHGKHGHARPAARVEIEDLAASRQGERLEQRRAGLVGSATESLRSLLGTPDRNLMQDPACAMVITMWTCCPRHGESL
jgi:hypothetical protein